MLFAAEAAGKDWSDRRALHEELAGGQECRGISWGLFGTEGEDGRVAALLFGLLQAAGRPPGDRMPPVKSQDKHLEPAHEMIAPADVHQFVSHQQAAFSQRERLQEVTRQEQERPERARPDQGRNRPVDEPYRRTAAEADRASDLVGLIAKRAGVVLGRCDQSSKSPHTQRDGGQYDQCPADPDGRDERIQIRPRSKVQGPKSGRKVPRSGRKGPKSEVRSPRSGEILPLAQSARRELDFGPRRARSSRELGRAE